MYAQTEINGEVPGITYNTYMHIIFTIILFNLITYAVYNNYVIIGVNLMGHKLHFLSVPSQVHVLVAPRAQYHSMESVSVLHVLPPGGAVLVSPAAAVVLDFLFF